LDFHRGLLPPGKRLSVRPGSIAHPAHAASAPLIQIKAASRLATIKARIDANALIATTV
jgi:hypothetical protein